MTPNRNILSLVLGMAGGLLILADAVPLLLANVMASGRSVPPLYGLGGGLGLSILSGGMVVVAALLSYLKPSQGVAWSIVMLVFSVTSLLGGFGGFFVGMALGVVGGALAMATALAQRQPEPTTVEP